MKLLNLKQTSCRQTDVVFATSAIANAVATVIGISLVVIGVYLVISGRIGTLGLPRWIAICAVLLCLLIVWLAGGSWKAAQRPSNWLLRIQGNDVLIKFRSYQNWRMSEHDPQVILLQKDEIAFIRNATQRQITRSTGPDKGVTAQKLINLEIGLKNTDTAELDKALADERARPGWGGEHNQTKMLDYPVELVGNDVIRIAWNSIRPSIKRALAELGEMAPVAESQSRTDDFTPTALKNLPEPEQHKRLAELASRNQLAAIETAKVLYRCSLSDARQLVEKIMYSSTQNLS